MSTCDVFNCLFPMDVQNEIKLLSGVFCFSWLVCLLGFWLRNMSLVKERNPISDGIVFVLDCKTVRMFAYSSTREQSDKRSGMRLKTESETGTDFFTDFEKKTDCFAVYFRFFIPCLMRKRVEKSEAILA